jgi:hypothetical protein
MDSKLISPINFDIFIWSSQQTVVYGSISWMNDLYQKLSDKLQHLHLEEHTQRLQEITDMLNHPEKPFIWFPLVKSSSSMHQSEFCMGKFYPFNRVVIHDIKHPFSSLISPTSDIAIKHNYSLVDFPGSPIRVLSTYYNTPECQLQNESNTPYNKFFQRSTYCKTCHLLQGTVSCKGLPLKHEVSPAVYYSSRLPCGGGSYTSSSTLCCDCEDATSFGRYTHQQTGLMKFQVGPEEILQIVTYLSGQLDPKTAMTNQIVLDENLALAKEDCLFLYQGLLHWLNLQLWKCFSFPSGVAWPYPPTDLQFLADALRKQKVWYCPPTSRSWISLENKETSSILYVAIDNYEVYKQFQSKLVEFIADYEEQARDDYQLMYKTIKLLPILPPEYCQDYTLPTADAWKVIQQVHTDNIKNDDEIGLNFCVGSFQVKYEQFLSQSVEEIRKRWNVYFPNLSRASTCKSLLLSELCHVPNISTISRKEYNYNILSPAFSFVPSKTSELKVAEKVYESFHQQYHKVILITLCFLQKYQSKDISSVEEEGPLYMANVETLFGSGEFYELLQLHHYVTESITCDVSLDFTSILHNSKPTISVPQNSSPYNLVNSTELPFFIIENRRKLSSGAVVEQVEEEEMIAVPEKSKDRRWIFLLSKDIKINDIRLNIRKFLTEQFFTPLLWKTMPEPYKEELLDLIKGTESVSHEKVSHCHFLHFFRFHIALF